MARWQFSASTVTMVPFSDSIASSFGTAVISFDFASVAIWPSTLRCSQPHACPCEGGGTAHVQGRLAIGPVVGAAQDLAIDRHDPLALPGERRHEPLERRAELDRIEQPEEHEERVVDGESIPHAWEFAQVLF